MYLIFFIVFLMLIIKYRWKIREPSDNPVKLLVFILTIQKLSSFRWAYIGSSYNEQIKISLKNVPPPSPTTNIFLEFRRIEKSTLEFIILVSMVERNNFFLLPDIHITQGYLKYKWLYRWPKTINRLFSVFPGRKNRN